LSYVRVVVVDDHEPFRHAVAAVVGEIDGFVVVGSAGSGEQSIELMAQTRPDLILMDVNLPGITGIEATRQLTAEPGAPVVVLLSTYDESEYDYRECGAAAYITKAAFSPDRLVDVWLAASA
jgi:DNA-binding NarL/FixJ family response regulator